MAGNLYSHMEGAPFSVPIQKPVEKRIRPGIASERSSADRPTSAKNSTSQNDQIHPGVVLEQQILDNMATLLAQMGFTLRYMDDRCKKLLSLIHDSAKTYRTALGAFEKLKVLVANLTSNASSQSNVVPEVPQATEEILTAVLKTNSSNENQRSNQELRKMSDNYSHMEPPFSLPIQKPVEKKIRPMNIERNSAIAAQNPSNLMDQTESLSTHSVEEQSLVATQSRSQDGPRVQNIYTRTGSSRDQTNFNQEIQHAMHERHYDMAAVDLRNVHQGVTNIASDSQGLPSSSHQRPSLGGQLYKHQNSPAQEEFLAHSNKNPYRIAITLMKTSGSTETNNYHHRLDSPTTRMRIPSNIENLTDSSDQMYQTSGLSQQRQQGVTKVLNSMQQTLSTTNNNYLLNEQQLKASQVANSTSNASSQSNVVLGVPQGTEEIHTAVCRAKYKSANSSNENQRSNDVVDKHQFVLPPEYDSRDTRWTLKYRQNLPGLVELMPQSAIYVSYGDLKYCQYVSANCSSLAARLLPKVFNRKALGVCSSMSENIQASNNIGSNVRPRLDAHATAIFLDYVVQHGTQLGWNIELQPILNALHKKIQKIRNKTEGALGSNKRS